MDTTRYVESEFPVYEYAVAGLNIKFRNRFSVKQALLLLLVAGTAVVGARMHYRNCLSLEKPTSSKLLLANYIKANTDPGDLLIVMDDRDPSLLYLSNRKGWAVTEETMSLVRPEYFPNARYLVGFKGSEVIYIDLRTGEKPRS